MKHIPIRLGPLALLLTVITICLSVLAMLSLSNSAADMRLSKRYADSVETRYLLEKDGQEYLNEMIKQPAADGAEVSKTFQREGYTLTIELEGEGGEYTVKRWQINKDWEESTDMGNLWQGE